MESQLRSTRRPERDRAPSGLSAVLAAMPEEAAAVHAVLRERRSVRRADPRIVTGRLGAARVALCITGDGARRARDGAQALLSMLPVQRLVLVGVSGALSPSLRAYDLLVAQQVIPLGAEPSADLVPDAAWIDRAVRIAGARPAAIVSSPEIADSVAAKRALLRTLPTEDDAAVDLESAWVARVAQAHAVPWMILRAVCDTADESLPALLNRSRDSRGGVRRARMVAALLADPRPLPMLLRLQRRVNRCATVLAQATNACLGPEA